ncbi:MAG: hypothetical protein M1840_001398 [Geoglossum simile]|nr:MAG: hypothetical protein M1840_001398 [Geoglossum simile]
MDVPEVSTKAPVSDALHGSAPPSSARAQDGAGIGEHCVKDRPSPVGRNPTGEICGLSDVNVYISKPSNYPHAPSKLLLFLTGGTGIHSVNNQLNADRFASEGFLVIMPDMFQGDPAPSSATTDTNDYTESHNSLIEQVKLRAAETAKSFVIDMWLARHTPEKVLPILYKVIEAAKEEFADAVANGGGVYAVGYCLGGKYVLLLAGDQSNTMLQGQALESERTLAHKGPLIKVGALAHGTLVTKEDIEAVKSPVSLACVENDQLFPDDVRLQGCKYLETSGVQHEVKVYKNVPHGFAILGEYDEPNIKEAQKLAYEQLLGWLQSH